MPPGLKYNNGMKNILKIPKPVRGILFHLIQWTWGLPQNLVGAVLALFLRGERFRYHGALVTIYHRLKFTQNRAGFSLGSFIFMPETWSDHDRKHLLVHEYGHTVQSLFLGPFYLFAVGLPSVLWMHRFGRKAAHYRSRGVNYTSRFPENEADRLGEAVTGVKPY